MGLIRAVFLTLGVAVGVSVAGQQSDNVGRLFASYISNDVVESVVAYSLIILGAIIVASIAGIIVQKIVSMLFLGFVDRLGGLALGLIAGVTISTAATIGMAHMTYNTTYNLEIPEGGPVGEILGGLALPPEDKVKHGLDNALTKSALVPTFIYVTDTIPVDTLGFVPSDFMTTLDVLKQRIKIEGEEPPSEPRRATHRTSAPKP